MIPEMSTASNPSTAMLTLHLPATLAPECILSLLEKTQRGFFLVGVNERTNDLIENNLSRGAWVA